MKATGIGKRIHNPERIAVPKEMRRILKIGEGHPMELFSGDESEIILKKHSHILDMIYPATEFAETAACVPGGAAVPWDTDNYAAAAGKDRKYFINRRIDDDGDDMIRNKKLFPRGKGLSAYTSSGRSHRFPIDFSLRRKKSKRSPIKDRRTWGEVPGKASLRLKPTADKGRNQAKISIPQRACIFL